MLVMDSGLGGMSVVRALRSAQPDVALTYLADTGGFPYGKRSAADITARAIALLTAQHQRAALSGVVLACNTLSTLCLEALRQHFSCPMIGTVPAVKVAAAAAKRFTLLATPNTADSAYSLQLIAQFAGDCVVDRYGAPNLARMAEQAMLGTALDSAALAAELRPAFHDDAHGRTQAVVLGCTHYPLIIEQLRACAPWPVEWIDSSAAIARRALSQIAVHTGPSQAFVTAPTQRGPYEAYFQREGFASTMLLEPAPRIEGAA